MKIHLYKCSECPTTSDEVTRIFTTWFEPHFDENYAYCPNCGRDHTVEYIGEKEIEEL